MHGYCYTSRISHLSKNHQVHNVMVMVDCNFEFCFVVVGLVEVGWVWVLGVSKEKRGKRSTTLTELAADLLLLALILLSFLSSQTPTNTLFSYEL